MTDRRKYLILMGAIVAAVVGALLLTVPGSPLHQKPVLGLDLQGGLEVVLKAVPGKNHVLTSSDMDKSVSIMQNRINKLGVSEPEIRKQGNDQIVIQLAGVHDPAAAAALIGKTAQLMLFDFENDLAGPSRDVNGNPVATPTLYGLLTQVQKQAAKGSPSQYYLFKTTTTVTPAKKVKGKPVGKPTVTTKHSLVAGPANTKQALLRPYGGTPPPRHEGPRRPADQHRRQVPGGERLPRRPAGPGVDLGHLLLPDEVRADEQDPPGAGDERLRPRPLGDEGGLRPERQPDRAAPVHESRVEPVPEDHA